MPQSMRLRSDLLFLRPGCFRPFWNGLNDRQAVSDTSHNCESGKIPFIMAITLQRSSNRSHRWLLKDIMLSNAVEQIPEGKLHFKSFYRGFCDGKVVVILISSKMNTYTCTFAVIKSEPAFQGYLKTIARLMASPETCTKITQ